MAYFNIKAVFPGVGIPMVKMRQSWDCLIFIMGMPVLVRWQLYFEMAPVCASATSIVHMKWLRFLIIPPASTKLKGGYTGITLSVCPSVRLSVCGQNRVRSVSSRILIGSILYLHILSSNFRRCVVCNAHFKIKKIEILVNFFKFVTLTLSSFDLGFNMTQWYG